MSVDVSTQTVIDRPVREVAEFASHPDNVPAWYVNIQKVEWETAPEVAIGARIAFVAQFMGRRMEYTYEIVELVADERLRMRTTDGPFPMETTYTWKSVDAGKTHMTLRNRGEPTGFSKLVSPLMSMAIRRANRKDLALLKTVLESK